MKIRIYTYQLTILKFLKNFIILSTLIYLVRITYILITQKEISNILSLSLTFTKSSMPFIFGWSLMSALYNQRIKVIASRVEDVNVIKDYILKYLESNNCLIITSSEKLILLSGPEEKKMLNFFRRKEYYKIIIGENKLEFIGPVKEVSKSEMLNGIKIK